MRKTNLIKIFSILLITLMVTLFLSINCKVFADDNDIEEELSIDGYSSDNTNDLGIKSTNLDTNTKNSGTENTNTNVNTANNNSSIYNSNNTSNLPKTGIGDSIPTAMLIVIFTISSIYAYRKIREYKNI